MIVVGLPIDLSGEIGQQAEKVEEFTESLKGYLSGVPGLARVKVIYWDERFSSAQAEISLKGSRLKNRSRREALDRISAALILESYLLSKQ